jgi:hypothetical protein
VANASKTHFGPAGHGKGAGVGAMTDDSILDGRLEENMVLSNRDKSRHSDERGLDSKMVQTEQYQDHAGNHQREDEVLTAGRLGENTSGLTGAMTDQSGENSSLETKRTS